MNKEGWRHNFTFFFPNPVLWVVLEHKDEYPILFSFGELTAYIAFVSPKEIKKTIENWHLEI